MRPAILFERKKPQAIPRVASLVPRKARPALDYLTEIADDPFAEIANDPAEAPLEDLSDRAARTAMEAFHQRQRQILNQSSSQYAGEYFRVIVFADGAQADAFMKAVGENPEDQYFDGRRVCDRLGIELPPDTWKARRVNTPNRRLAALARGKGE